MAKPDLSILTLSTALEQLYRQDYSALELTEACLERIKRLNPTINAFITLTPELAAQGALQADLLIGRHPSNLAELDLLGIPVGIKDMLDIAGVPTTAGTKFFSDKPPIQDAQVVRKLKSSGAVILGKTNTHEIALGVTGVNPHYGPVRNPWELAHISGGSSSGSAAAVAAGMCLAALGTDTGGSIRIPAALCGVVGLKPTYGRVSLRGVVPLSWNLDHIGSLTRTVRDAARMLSVIAGFDPHDPASVNVPLDDPILQLKDQAKNWRIACAAGNYIEVSGPDVLESLDAAVQAFRSMGAHIEKVDMSWLADLAQANGRMTQADAAAFHLDRLREHPDWFGVDVLQRLKNGAALTSSEYVMARKTQVDGRRRFEIFFEKYDLLLLPTTPISAPLIEETGAIEAARSLTRFTSPFNLTGLPVISIPCGFSTTGMPLGLQIVSKYWAEEKVLQAGNAFEDATEWHNHHPNI